MLLFLLGRRCPLPNIENGEIANITDFQLGDQITFVCNKGWVPSMTMEFSIKSMSQSMESRGDPVFAYSSLHVLNVKIHFPFRHRLIGQNSAHCVFEDGNVVWNRDPPHCERKMIC